MISIKISNFYECLHMTNPNLIDSKPPKHQNKRVQALHRLTDYLTHKPYF